MNDIRPVQQTTQAGWTTLPVSFRHCLSWMTYAYYGPLKKKTKPGCEEMRSAESMLIGALGNSCKHVVGCLSTVRLDSSNCQHVMPCVIWTLHNTGFNALRNVNSFRNRTSWWYMCSKTTDAIMKFSARVFHRNVNFFYFCRAMLCVPRLCCRAVFVSVCLFVRLSVLHVRALCRNE